MVKQFLIYLLSFIALATCQPIGGPSIDGRVAGGEMTDITEYPYMVAVQKNYNFICAGVIIARTWILTTNGCVDDSLDASIYSIRYGSTDQSTEGQVINASRIITHPQGEDEVDYDISLLQLEKPIPLSNVARIVRLPINENVMVEGSLGNLTGWGATKPEGLFATDLRVVQVPVMSYSVCRDIYADLGYNITERMICAGFWEGGKGACRFDRGSALVIDSVVYGLGSWLLMCGQPQRPEVYTNVAVFRDWITAQTGI